MDLRFPSRTRGVVLAFALIVATVASSRPVAADISGTASGLGSRVEVTAPVTIEAPAEGAGEPAPSAIVPDAAVAPPPAKSAAARDYYVKARGYRIVPDTDPPRYVRDTSKTDVPVLRDVDWLDFGLEHRMRFEYRDDSFLRTPQEGQDYPFLLRSRMFFGVKKVFDPFRFAFELEDSRWQNSMYRNTNREVNEYEPIQLYGELFFDDPFGDGRPLFVRGGRMAFELVDRRLVANNQFRNTTNNFQGVRAKWGKQTNAWDVDVFVTQPIDRLLYDFDETFDEQWFYGGVFSWRPYSEIATVQPYWFGFSQGSTTEKPSGSFNLQTVGVRAYGIVGKTGWDWDTDVVYQFGDWVDGLTQAAGAFALEVGYTVEDWAWKPRFSGFFGYGSGDEDPDDGYNNSFNALFGFNQPWSRNDYFSWDNGIMPKARVELAPAPNLLIDAGYGAFWLASSTAAWQRAGLRDPTGKSGDFLGNEWDIRIRYTVLGRIGLEWSYSRFNPGGFPKKLGKPLPSNFFYFQVNLSLFE